MASTVKIEKEIPIIADVDVLVAGGGIAGCTAALTAARSGARTMVIDRYGCLGGNMGPGMFSGGYLHLALGYPMAMLDGLKGIPGEFINRCEGYCDGQLGHNKLRDSQVVSYIWFKLMEENGVQLLLNTYGTDPIAEEEKITGLIVENKSGTQAIKAKVVIDATGDADLAARAGAHTDNGSGYSAPGMFFATANVNEEKYLSFLAETDEPSEEDLCWTEEVFKKLIRSSHRFRQIDTLRKLIPFFRRAWENGEYRVIKQIGDLACVYIDHGIYPPIDGIVDAQIGLHGSGILSGNSAMMTQLEVAARIYIFETAQFLRRHIPGFENSYLLVTSPYFHARGGRSAISEYDLTTYDVSEGRRFDDVIFVVYCHQLEERVEGGSDFPYRQLLPRGVEGLLVTGRSAIIQPPSMRGRWKVFLMGQAAGLAAAIAANAGVTPREIDIKDLQRLLLYKYHVPLGDKERLRELGLI